MRIIALLASYNEERFIGGCLEHLIAQGLEVYLCDNQSTDRTVAIAQRYLRRGLIAIEMLPRKAGYDWKRILRRKEELAASLDADWFMHADPDEVRLPPRSDQTLAEAFADVQSAGFNAVNFFDYTFVPTRESPDHDHPNFQRTMRWYYNLERHFPRRLNAWRRPPRPSGLQRLIPRRRPLAGQLCHSGGHRVGFPGLRMYPQSFPMRHYLYLSPGHAAEKYGGRGFRPSEVKEGWHGWRAHLDDATAAPPLELLPSAAELRAYTSDDALDPSEPLLRDVWAERWAEFVASGAAGGAAGGIPMCRE